MICKKEYLLLKEINIVDNNIVRFKFKISENLSKYFNRNYILIEYPDSINLHDIPESILIIPFVSCLLPLMWLTDSIMWISEIDRTFYHSLHYIKNGYQEMYDYYVLKGSLIPAKIVENDYKIFKKSLVLFSGGLDAHTTYLRHINEKPLLFYIQGWYEDDFNSLNKVERNDIINISTFANMQNVKFMSVRSNFATTVNNDTFHKYIERKLQDNWWHGFQHSMAFISIAIPISYYFGIKQIYIASSFCLGDAGRCASYPTTDSEFAFATKGIVIHDGFELSRQDKIKMIIDYQKQIHDRYPLKVCTFKEENCCICEKCIRTILGIIAENGDPEDFGFHLNKPILTFFTNDFIDNIVFFDVEGESIKHWKYIKERMRTNFHNIEEKDFVNWFLTVDLLRIRKKKLLEYRIKNFPYLLLKRLKNLKV